MAPLEDLQILEHQHSPGLDLGWGALFFAPSIIVIGQVLCWALGVQHQEVV